MRFGTVFRCTRGACRNACRAVRAERRGGGLPKGVRRYPGAGVRGRTPAKLSGGRRKARAKA